MTASLRRIAALTLVVLLAACAGTPQAPRIAATGDMGVIIERGSGSVLVVDRSERGPVARIEGLGDLSHASVVFSPDERYAYVFGRDGGLTKLDIVLGRIDRRIIQGGNSIGGAISQDGRLIAVSNYEPGGVKVFDADTLELVADVPAEYGSRGATSKTVGLVDAPGNRFVFSLWDAGEIWLLHMEDPSRPRITKFTDIGHQPYDALVSGDGRIYIAGLFGEDGLAKLDLWHPQQGVSRILDHYGRGEKAMPVYKMPHLEGWAVAGNHAFLPAVGHHQLLVIDMGTWQEVGRIDVHGQPVFAMARPDGRQVWVNFALPHNDTIQVIDVPTRRVMRTFKPGKAVLHMEFEPRGRTVWMSVRDENRVEIWDTVTLEKLAEFPAEKPSGIFFTSRAHRIGL